MITSVKVVVRCVVEIWTRFATKVTTLRLSGVALAVCVVVRRAVWWSFERVGLHGERTY